MIAVIADDFTGAAEIGGIGIRHGFDVTILNNSVEEVNSDILIIATDTRSQLSPESGRVINKITRALLLLQQDFIYKKVDSLLRGNVGEELMVQLEASKKSRALIIPANPALKRTIQEGVYYVDGVPIEEYSFSGGAEGRRKSSRVQDLIGKEARPFTSIISTGESLPVEGLIIGNTTSDDDLAAWVQKIDSRTIPAGSSGFFDALLQTNSSFNGRKQPPMKLGERAVYVCGSAFVPSRQLVQKAKESGQSVMYMPANIFSTAENFFINVSGWADEIIQELNSSDKVILAVDEINSSENENLALKIKETFAEVLHLVMEEIEINELIIEGGATAYSIIKKLGYKKFFPVQELGPGVIRMKVEGNNNLFLTLKPGSYQWPNSIWQY